MSNSHLSVGRIYRWPMFLASVIIAGLLFALFGDGIWDAVSWVLLAIPIGVTTRKLFTRP